jgi:aspartate aminotransferase
MYTNVATPIQYAAVTAYSINHELDEYMANVKNIHSIVGKYFSHYAKSLNLEVSTPKSAFYLIVNFNPLREILEANDIYTSSQLSQKLLRAPYYVAVVMGAAISVDEEDFIARIALVDYDGASALKDFIKNPPRNNDEISQFIDRNMFHMKLGFKMISQFIEELKKPV